VVRLIHLVYAFKFKRIIYMVSKDQSSVVVVLGPLLVLEGDLRVEEDPVDLPAGLLELDGVGHIRKIVDSSYLELITNLLESLVVEAGAEGGVTINSVHQTAMLEGDATELVVVILVRNILVEGAPVHDVKELKAQTYPQHWHVPRKHLVYLFEEKEALIGVVGKDRAVVFFPVEARVDVGAAGDEKAVELGDELLGLVGVEEKVRLTAGLLDALGVSLDGELMVAVGAGGRIGTPVEADANDRLVAPGFVSLECVFDGLLFKWRLWFRHDYN